MMNPPESETLETLASARSVFRGVLEKITEADWGLPTPCEEWTVRDVVDHVIVAEAAVLPMLGIAQAGPPPEQGDPMASWSALAATADDAFAKPGALEAPVEHPYVGQITGHRLAWFRIGDNVLHGWDLARAIGADDSLPPGLVTTLYERAVEAETRPADTGLFAPPPELPADADPQSRLLAHFGRSPSWRAQRATARGGAAQPANVGRSTETS